MNTCRLIKPRREEMDVIGTHAHVWLERMKAGDAKNNRELVRWLKQSPLHVREMLLATAWQLVLDEMLDPHNKMGPDAPRLQHATDVAERAKDWLERIRHSHHPSDGLEYLAWLRESPLHVREMLHLTTGRNELIVMLESDHKTDIDVPRPQGAANVMPRISSASSDATTTDATPLKPRSMQASRIGRSWLTGWGVAACLAIALALGWSQVSGYRHRFSTAIGEQRSVGLADGSVVYLNTQSRVRVTFSATARDIYLLEGQANFKVKHDATRPFRVHLDAAVVQAIGTQFDVYKLKDRTSVTVIEGMVQIIPGASGSIDVEALSKLPANTKVPAGETVTIVADGTLSLHANVAAEEATAWQERRLIFHRETLATIAAEFNRYNRAPRIRVEGEALRAKRYFGAFHANDPQSFIQYLEAMDRDRHLAIDRSDNEVVIRMRSSLSQSDPAIQ